MPAHLFEQLHGDWQKILEPFQESILRIEKQLSELDIAPEYSNIFRTLGSSLATTKVVIFGQDPYPTRGHANGLAFSVEASVKPLPPSLRNIFTELESDCGIRRSSGDLADWFNQGVLLLNRILTTQIGSSLFHAEIGWQEITNAVACELGQRDVVAILWGKNAAELAHYFRPEWLIQSVHPSPLSAYRGFFGSKPFSTCNQKLVQKDMVPIKW